MVSLYKMSFRFKILLCIAMIISQKHIPSLESIILMDMMNIQPVFYVFFVTMYISMHTLYYYFFINI